MDDNVNINVDTHGTPAENLQRLITECGVSPHKVQELVQELPPKQFADRLINWYFNHLNVVRYPIDERLFRGCKRYRPLMLTRSIRRPLQQAEH